MTHGRALAAPAFRDDDGSIDPVLQTAIDATDCLADNSAIIGALCTARVFVPVIALLGEVPIEGDKDAEMAAVFMTGADGRKALLTFSSVAAMQAWDQESRPVAIFGHDAARAALDEDAAALLLDLGSSHFSVVETDDLVHLAAGHRLVQSAAGAAWLTS